MKFCLNCENYHINNSIIMHKITHWIFCVYVCDAMHRHVTISAFHIDLKSFIPINEFHKPSLQQNDK